MSGLDWLHVSAPSAKAWEQNLDGADQAQGRTPECAGRCECSAEILRRCRKTPIGRWVMRGWGADPKVCGVIDLGRSEAVDGSSWKRRDVRVAVGSSWCEVLARMPEALR